MYSAHPYFSLTNFGVGKCALYMEKYSYITTLGENIQNVIYMAFSQQNVSES